MPVAPGPDASSPADSLQQWRMVAARVGLNPEQRAALADWRARFLRRIDDCYGRRLLQKAQLAQLPGTSGSQWVEALLLQAAESAGYSGALVAMLVGAKARMQLAGGQPAHRLVTCDFRSRLRSPHDSQKRQQRLRLGMCRCIFDCLPVPHPCPTGALPSPLPAACALACAQLDEMVSQLGQNVAEERAAVCDFMTELLDGLLTKVGMRGLNERRGGAQGWPWVERAVNSLVQPGCGSMGGSCLPALTVASSWWSANRRSHWALQCRPSPPPPMPFQPAHTGPGRALPAGGAPLLLEWPQLCPRRRVPGTGSAASAAAGAAGRLARLAATAATAAAAAAGAGGPARCDSVAAGAAAGACRSAEAACGAAGCLRWHLSIHPAAVAGEMGHPSIPGASWATNKAPAHPARYKNRWFWPISSILPHLVSLQLPLTLFIIPAAKLPRHASRCAPPRHPPTHSAYSH